jgi:hypothetical protein
MRIVLGIKNFPRKTNPVLQVCDSQEFENIRIFGLDLTSWISKFAINFFRKLHRQKNRL